MLSRFMVVVQKGAFVTQMGCLACFLVSFEARAQLSPKQALEASWGIACEAASCPNPLPKSTYHEPKGDLGHSAPIYPDPPTDIRPIKLQIDVNPIEVWAGQDLEVSIKTNKACELWLVDQSPSKDTPAAVLTPAHPAYSQFIGAPLLAAETTRILQFQADNNPGYNTLVALCFIGRKENYGFSQDHIKSQLDGYRKLYGKSYEAELSKHVQRALPADKVGIAAKTVLIR